MSPAFLALWNGVLPERRAEYEAWHGIEHMPERIGAPGFRGARRYRAEDGDDYFTLYELDAVEALATPEYRALMDHPTRWSARMRPALTGFRRLPCRTVFARGFGLGGAVATLRVGAVAAEVLPSLQPWLEDALDRGALLGAVVGDSAESGQSYAVFPDAPAPGAESCVVLEGTEPDAVAALSAEAAAVLPKAERRRWRLLQVLQRDQLRDPAARRQAPREDLLTAWSGG